VLPSKEEKKAGLLCKNGL